MSDIYVMYSKTKPFNQWKPEWKEQDWEESRFRNRLRIISMISLWLDYFRYFARLQGDRGVASMNDENTTLQQTDG